MVYHGEERLQSHKKPYALGVVEQVVGAGAEARRMQGKHAPGDASPPWIVSKRREEHAQRTGEYFLQM